MTAEQLDKLYPKLLDDLEPSLEKFADRFARLTAQDREKVLLMLDIMLQDRSA